MTMMKKLATAATLLALTALGGCDWFKPAPPPESSSNGMVVENVEEPDQPSAPPRNSAEPAESNAAAAAELRAAPPPPDTQTQDDADAVGMTAHVRRDEAADNSAAP